MLWRDFSPKTSGCTGTVRQPMTLWPLASTMRSKWRSTFSLSTISGGRKMKPTAYLPGSGKSISSFAHSFTKKLCGICSRTPAPSPELASAPWPPRWSILCSTTSACFKILLDFLPLMLATTPTPQASCSNQGSYRPCLAGSEVFISIPLSHTKTQKSKTVILIIISPKSNCKLYTCIFLTSLCMFI